MYYFLEDYDREQNFYFSREWIESGAWANMSKATKANLPVICSHCDDEGICFPGQKRISILSGLSERSTVEGIKGLKSFEHINIAKRESRHGRLANVYEIRRSNRGFPVYSSIFHAGLWLMASRSAKALYMPLRCYGGLSGGLIDIYADIEGLDFDLDEYREIYKGRKWEVCDATEEFLCRKAGIHRNSFKSAMDSLIKVGLVLPPLEKYHIEGYRVAVRPMIKYKRDYLNLMVKERYLKE